MPEPDFLTSINARMALETPQVVAAWEFANAVSPFDATVPWDWTEMRLRRSRVKYPTSSSDGDAILTESWSVTPSTSKADITVAEDLTYYYSLYFQYPEIAANQLLDRQDVSRLYSHCRGLVSVPYLIKVTGADMITLMGGTVVSSATATFQTNGIEAGDWLEILTGADAGTYVVDAVTSETSLTLTTPTPNGDVGQSFRLRSDEPRWATAGTTHERHPAVFIYNAQTHMVDRAFDFSQVLVYSEELVGVLCFDDTGANEKLQVVTNLRYLRFANPAGGDLTETLTTAEIANQWVLESKLRGGYIVSGTSLIDSFAGMVNPDIGFLDASHAEVKVLGEVAGALVNTFDLSGLEKTDKLWGLSQDKQGTGAKTYVLVGNSNYVYAIDDDDLSVTPANVHKLTYTRDALDGGLAWDSVAYSYFGTNRLAVVCNGTGFMDWYSTSVGRGYLWQQPYVADDNTIGLYHFDAASHYGDSSQYGNTAVPSGGAWRASAGRFNGGAFETVLDTDYLDCPVDAQLNGDLGSASVWFKAASLAEWAPTGPVPARAIFSAAVDVGNYLCLAVIDFGTGPVLFFSRNGGGIGEVAIVGPHPSPDLLYHHYKVVWDQASPRLELFVDGVSVTSDTVSALGAWAAGATAVWLGGTVTIGVTTLPGIKGYFDEARISDVVRAIPTAVSSWTSRNMCHAYSGKDPTNRAFNYRDEMWTPKYMGGEWLIRNDHDVQPTQENLVLADGEVVFRQTTKKLGDLGRLSRMFGLFLDRMTDDRDHMMDALVRIETADDDFFDSIAAKLGIQGLDPNWNVDQRRRWTSMMRRVLRSGGRTWSYHKLSGLLGYKLVISTLYSRRYLDSVRSPTRPDVYLDQQGSLDTRDARYPLAFLRMAWYRSAFYSQTGGASGARLLSDAAGTFVTTARPGSLVRIYNLADHRNDGDYFVVSVINGTTLLLNRDWTVSPLTDMHYSVNTHVPTADPLARYLLSRMKFIQPKMFRLSAT